MDYDRQNAVMWKHTRLSVVYLVLFVVNCVMQTGLMACVCGFFVCVHTTLACNPEWDKRTQ